MSYIICKKDLKSTRRGGQMVTFLVPPGFYGFHPGSTRVPPGFHPGSTGVPPGFHRGSTGVFGRWNRPLLGGVCGEYLKSVDYIKDNHNGKDKQKDSNTLDRSERVGGSGLKSTHRGLLGRQSYKIGL